MIVLIRKPPGFIYSRGGGDPSPIGASGSGGVRYDLLLVNRGFIDSGGSDERFSYYRKIGRASCSS